uniref:aminotransferase class III-fold pyridoxal phosphate-dependent enzyme n=1 Tax=Maribacter sp. 2-571 TaxID=3417569 RepID=UPI003D344133
DVRGRGMMIGVEFVKDKATKEPNPEYLKELRAACFQRGLLFESGGHHGNVMRLVPPLITTHRIVDNAIVILKRAIRSCSKEAAELQLS